MREHLLRYRGRALHVIDPYKVAVPEACAKVTMLADSGAVAVLVGSTQYRDFNRSIPTYVTTLRGVAGIPVILHFPPRRAIGVPLTDAADAVISPTIPDSVYPYFHDACHRDTLRHHELQFGGGRPEILRSTAFAFGPDPETFAAVGAQSASERPSVIREAAEACSDADIVYLFSRHGAVACSLCAQYRQLIRRDQLLFVSGGVHTHSRIDELLACGADYVVFGTALETRAWREELLRLMERDVARVS
jgi:heptaprenylglyceryl phosphate synthase